MTGSFTLQQQAFLFSILSNTGASDTGASIAANVAASCNAAFASESVQPYIGNAWSLAWGPGVTFDPKKTNYADNVMFAARNSDTGDVVVAIAGTSGHSPYDVKIEDLNVGSMVVIDPVSGAAVSAGTSEGVKNLQTMTDSSGSTLLGFLNQLAGSDGTLVFTGHSLGGALSPAFALYSVMGELAGATNFAITRVYASAGPTPGNAAFVSLFGKYFPFVDGDVTQAWNANIRNSLDTVPHAWDRLASLPGLYQDLNNGAPVPCVDKLVTEKLQPAVGQNIYSALPFVEFTGTFNPDIRNPLERPVNNYAVQALYQHVEAYYHSILNTLPTHVRLPSIKLPARVFVALDLYCDT